MIFSQHNYFFAEKSKTGNIIGENISQQGPGIYFEQRNFELFSEN